MLLNIQNNVLDYDAMHASLSSTVKKFTKWTFFRILQETDEKYQQKIVLQNQVLVDSLDKNKENLTERDDDVDWVEDSDDNMSIPDELLDVGNSFKQMTINLYQSLQIKTDIAIQDKKFTKTSQIC